MPDRTGKHRIVGGTQIALLPEIANLVRPEHRFEVDDAFVLPSFDEALRDHIRELRGATTVLEAMYYDTEDFTLLSLGTMLRRRSGGTEPGWRLDLSKNGAGARLEIHVPLGTDEAAVPEEIEELVADQARSRPVRPVLRVRTMRTVTDLVDSDGATLMAIADDRVLSLRPSDLALAYWREIAIEDRSATTAAVRRIGDVLCAHGASPAPYGSKYEYGLRASKLRRARTLDRTDPLTARLRVQAAVLVACEADVRAELDDSVHRMRVAARRLQGCLRTFRTAFEPEPTRHLNAELDWLGANLGAVRDAEVIAARIANDLNELGTEAVPPSVQAALAYRGSAAVRTAQAELVDVLSSTRSQTLLNELAAFATKPPFRSSKPKSAFMRERVSKAMRRTERLVETVATTEGEARDIVLHDVRRDAKQVRYAFETVIPIYGKRARRLARRYASLQELLGEQHDAVVTRGVYLAEAVRAGAESAEVAATYGALIARETFLADAAESAFAGTWKRVEKASRTWAS